jgi:hypothetical protein
VLRFFLLLGIRAAFLRRVSPNSASAKYQSAAERKTGSPNNAQWAMRNEHAGQCIENTNNYQDHC